MLQNMLEVKSEISKFQDFIQNWLITSESNSFPVEILPLKTTSMDCEQVLDLLWLNYTAVVIHIRVQSLLKLFTLRRAPGDSLLNFISPRDVNHG